MQLYLLLKSQQKQYPPAALRATAGVACCRRPCFTGQKQHSKSTQPSKSYYVPVCTCVLLCTRLLLSSLVVLSRSSSCFCFRKPHAYCRSSERDIASKHSTAQGDQLCTSSFWHYQTPSCTKSWASSFCLVHILLYAPDAARGAEPLYISEYLVFRPRSGALVHMRIREYLVYRPEYLVCICQNTWHMYQNIWYVYTRIPGIYQNTWYTRIPGITRTPGIPEYLV